MIIFFYFLKPINVHQNEFGFQYQHKFDAVPKLVDKKVPFDSIYFSTPSDFHNHVEKIKTQYGEEMAEQIRIVEPPKIIEHPEFPHHIGFYKSWDKMISEVKQKYPGNGKLSLALSNGMSNAIGDHLIGMSAFTYWREKLIKDLDREIDISFYQLNPYRVAPVTKQHSGKYQHIYMLPNRLMRFMEHDLFVDLGTLLLRENFGTQPMIDFFFEALSINPNDVPPEAKRNQFKVLPEINAKLDNIFRVIRSKKRPILLFHRTSTSPIRHMSDERARRMIADIIKESDYFVVSADRLEYQNARFMDLSQYSPDLDNFAGIISKVDGIATVDTSTYHISDAFSVPTVSMFTTINPDYRIRYYPYNQPIELEKEGGKLYGRHKADKDEKKAREEIAYVDQMWDRVTASMILEKLEAAKTRREI